MADFDNGIAPSSASLAGTNISQASHTVMQVTDSDKQQIRTVSQSIGAIELLQKQEVNGVAHTVSNFEDAEALGINSISHAKELMPTKVLYCSFL